MTASPSPNTLPTAERGLLQQLEIDSRLLGMIGALVVLCIGFNLLTDGRFLTPRNLFNLSIQTVSVAIMASGMVFVIVTRHIDLSVGALLATSSAVMAMTQTQVLPHVLGFWRNVAWYLTSGQTIGPLDSRFMVFGGTNGTLGTTWSWVIGIVACAAVLVIQWRSRRVKLGHGFNVKPVWAELALAGVVVATILGFIATLNAYNIPTRRLKRLFEARGETMPEGLVVGYGLPISVLILIAVAVVMTLIARRTRFGRYIFATGGNPDAAELSGINTRWLTVKLFALMGFLCALSAVVASSRLANHSNDIGTLDELRVIAAAVIGGTALSGGIGTIHGAILGALIMQALQSGMAMVGVDAPFQNIVVGSVLVAAVLIDIIYRKRLGVRQ